MSKYEESIVYTENGNVPLSRGEKILLQAKPKKKAFILNKALYMAPVAIIWLLFDSFFISAAFNVPKEESSVLLFLVPFLLFHLMPVWIWLFNIATANRKWKNTQYIVTDKRIIIQHGLISDNYQTLYYKDIKNVTLRVGIIDRMLGVGDIYFTPMFLDYSYGEQKYNVNQPAFLDLENYKEVYAMVQKTVLDIQTDIEYPNALRPSENPGYNTKYGSKKEK